MRGPLYAIPGEAAIVPAPTTDQTEDSTMSTPRRRAPLGALLVLPLLLFACASGIEGKYYNSSSGEYALELKGGKVTYAQGMLEGQDLVYEVRGDSLVIRPPQGDAEEELVFGIESDGTLSLGMFGTLTKNRP